MRQYPIYFDYHFGYNNRENIQITKKLGVEERGVLNLIGLSIPVSNNLQPKIRFRLLFDEDCRDREF